MFAPIEKVLSSQWEGGNLDALGASMQMWRGAGQFDNLRKTQLRSWLSTSPPGKRVDMKTKPPPRWRTWGVVIVARLLRDRQGDLQEALRLDVWSRRT